MAAARCDVLGCACGCHRAVRRQVPRLWTPGMDHELRAAVVRGDHPSTIAATMHLSIDSVKWRIKSLGLSLRDGWHSREDVAATLGVSRRAVARWARQGELPCMPHGRRWTRVTDADLRAFVERYAGILFGADSVTDPVVRRLAETAALANRRRAV